MKSFEFESLEQAYPALIEALMNEGKEVSPRGMLTKEISPVGFTINNPRKRVIPNKVRNLNFGFMNAELLWILRGSNGVDEIGHYNKQWFNFSDDNKTLNGAYGQRIFKWDGLFDVFDTSWTDEDGNPHSDFNIEHIVIDQFDYAYRQLVMDKDTRQATIVLFNPVQDIRETKDKPCTNLLRFTIRENKLNMTVFMRSNDIILGTPYDIYNFTMLQEIMAGKLDIEVGKYTHIVDSLHIYENHFEMARDILNNPEPLLYGDELVDARLKEENINKELDLMMDIEALTRLQSEVVKVEHILELLDNVENEYWRSIGAVIAAYNFRKARRSQEELDKIKKYITNEFSNIETIKNWKPLA